MLQGDYVQEELVLLVILTGRRLSFVSMRILLTRLISAMETGDVVISTKTAKTNKFAVSVFSSKTAQTK